MTSNNSPVLALSDSVWEIIQYIVESSHQESFPGLFDLLHLYHTNQDWKKALNTSNGSRAWNVTASRSLGAPPPFSEDPALAEDIEDAVRAFILIFSGGECPCGTFIKDLPFAYVNGEFRWICQVTCQHGTLAHLADPTVMHPKDAAKWDKWRRSAQRAIKDPVSLSSKRLKAALNDWFEWSSWTWEDTQGCQHVLDAFDRVCLNGVPLSYNGCHDLAKLVMEHFTDLDARNDTIPEDLEHWSDSFGDADENMMAYADKESDHIPAMPTSPFGSVVFNRTPNRTRVLRV